jgi:hypothetical protein
MLDALSDFWKPMKKPQSEKLKPEQLQVGSAIVFGFVPQASLSGRRMQITTVNTYQFGSEALTSFVLMQERDPGISMIVAESDGEQYLAISRRITISDRIKMFDSNELESITEKSDITQLTCRDNPEFKGWTVSTYRREIQGMKGLFHSGDFRKNPLPGTGGQEFKYSLLASENNEHAIEIEKYPDGRVEIYATVYRRTSDITEVAQPMRPDLKLASKPESKPMVTDMKPSVTLSPVKTPAPMHTVEKTPEPIKPQESSAPTAPEKKPDVQPATTASTPFTPSTQPFKPQETKPMPLPEAAAESLRNFPVNNGAAPKLSSMQSTNETIIKQEIKPVTKTNGLDANEAVECDLRVANKIIEEAISNEMRLSDVVRRIIELPVAHQESVHIPVTLSDDDFSLLAIRYGISASDRNAIKRRIIEDLNGFSGKK